MGKRTREDLFEGEPQLPTSALSRLSRIASAAARTGARTLLGRFRKNDDEWGQFDPEAIEALVRALGELKGLPMKIGQIISFVDDTLPPEVRRMLSVLQTQSFTTDLQTIHTVIAAELGPRAGDLLRTLEPVPVSSASIGQVHRATLPTGENVAVKVQHPGIKDAIRAEFGAAAAGLRIAKYFLPGDTVHEFVAEAKERLLEECDYRLEARHQERFGTLYSGHAHLVVPRVFVPYSTTRILTTEWQPGIRFDVWLEANPTQAERNLAGAELYDFYLGTLYRSGIFNADPHPGNYLFRPGPQIVMLDYGSVREFAPERIRAFVRLRRAVAADSRPEIRKALVSLGAADPGDGKLYGIARDLLRAFFGPTLRDEETHIPIATGSTLAQIMADKMNLAKLSLPGDMLLLFRIKFGLYAVLSRIGAEVNWCALEEGWSREVPSA